MKPSLSGLAAGTASGVLEEVEERALSNPGNLQARIREGH